MKKWLRIAVGLGMTALLSIPGWGEATDRPFYWADDENFEPLIYRNEAGKPEGIFYDVVTTVFARMQVPLRVDLYPWSRAQKMVREGEADGMVTVYTKRRQAFLAATDPIVTVEERVFANRNNPKIEEIMAVRSLEGLKKFVLVDTVDSGWSKENLKGMHVIWVPTPESALNMVASGRADIYLMSSYTGPCLVREQIKKGGPLRDRLKEIVMGAHPFTKMEYRLLIRKDSPHVGNIERFNRTLRRMRRDGIYDKLIARHRIEMEKWTEK